MSVKVINRLVEIPRDWANGGSFWCEFPGVDLQVHYGDEIDEPFATFEFEWVRSFRFVSEASYDSDRDGIDPDQAFLSELPLPDQFNPSNDYYGDQPEAGKTSPRLFRVFHYKAGFLDVVASSVHATVAGKDAFVE